MADAEDAKKESGADDAVADTDGDGDSAEPKKAKKKSKKLLLFGVVPLVLLIAGVGGAYMMNMLGAKEDPVAAKKKAEETRRRNLVYFPVPEILVNLNSTTSKTHYLKIKISLELASKNEISRIESVMPRIIDNFQVYLRELRIEDLRGSAGLYRLREELLTRVNAAAAPAKVTDVLFKEMLVQ